MVSDDFEEGVMVSDVQGGTTWPGRFWRSIVGVDRTALATTEAAPATTPGPKTDRPSPTADGNSVRADHGHPVGNVAAGNGVRLWHAVLATAGGVATLGHLGQAPSDPAGALAGGRPDRLVAGRGGFGFRASRFGGSKRDRTPRIAARQARNTRSQRMRTAFRGPHASRPPIATT